MEGPSPEFALTRIDAALARIEAAIARGPAHTDSESSDLAARHQQLRAAVTDSLRDLDGLIGSQ